MASERINEKGADDGRTKREAEVIVVEKGLNYAEIKRVITAPRAEKPGRTHEKGARKAKI